MAQTAEATISSLSAVPQCIDASIFDTVFAAAKNWTAAGTNQLLRETVTLRRNHPDAARAPFQALDMVALLYSVQVLHRLPTRVSVFFSLPVFP